MINFAWPLVFLLLPLPWLVYKFLPSVSQQQPAVRVPFYQEFKDATLTNQFQPSSLKNYLLWIKILCWVLLVTAAARPQWLGPPVAQQTSGRDLLLAIDISNSMEQTDLELDDSPATRLTVVKSIVEEFIKNRKGDRLGLVLFGSQAYLQAPLTFDAATVSKFLRETQLGFAGPKTAIGDAIGISVKRLQMLDSSNDNQVVILLTDGANTEGEVSPLQAALLAKQTGIKIYTIGVGAEEMRVRSFFGTRTLNPSSQLDEETLVKIASETGGKYYRARNTNELNGIYQEINNLEPTVQESQWLRPVTSLFKWPLTALLILIATLALIKNKKFIWAKLVGSRND